MACEPLVSERNRAEATRPPRSDSPEMIAALNNKFGDLDGDSEMAETQGKWEELADKYELLEEKVNEYLDGDASMDARDLPVVKCPPTMTREE